MDRGNRRLILALGVGLWSCAMAATRLAQGFVSLALCRVFIGVREATVFPVAMSLVADLHPGPRLARSVSVFQASAGVGIMIGSVLAGPRPVAAGGDPGHRGDEHHAVEFARALRRPGGFDGGVDPAGATSTPMLIVQTLVAFALGALIIGVASDALKPLCGAESLRYALSLMPAAPLAASLLLWIARRRLTRAAD